MSFSATMRTRLIGLSTRKCRVLSSISSPNAEVESTSAASGSNVDEKSPR